LSYTTSRECCLHERTAEAGTYLYVEQLACAINITHLHRVILLELLELKKKVIRTEGDNRGSLDYR